MGYCGYTSFGKGCVGETGGRCKQRDMDAARWPTGRLVPGKYIVVHVPPGLHHFFSFFHVCNSGRVWCQLLVSNSQAHLANGISTPFAVPIQGSSHLAAEKVPSPLPPTQQRCRGPNVARLLPVFGRCTQRQTDVGAQEGSGTIRRHSAETCFDM